MSENKSHFIINVIAHMTDRELEIANMLIMAVLDMMVVGERDNTLMLAISDELYRRRKKKS